jgi:hypothetical protein
MTKDTKLAIMAGMILLFGMGLAGRFDEEEKAQPDEGHCVLQNDQTAGEVKEARK